MFQEMNVYVFHRCCFPGKGIILEIQGRLCPFFYRKHKKKKLSPEAIVVICMFLCFCDTLFHVIREGCYNCGIRA